MTAKTIDDMVTRAELSLPEDLRIEIDERRDLRGRQLYGYTWPDGLRVTLYPDAFQTEEELIRTLAHELTHVRQVRSAGATTDSVVLAAREREAYAEEEHQWRSYLERQ
jgi:hypothetical protein